MNKVYAEFFTKEPYPSRATVVVRELVGPPGIRVEATAQAYLLSFNARSQKALCRNSVDTPQ